MRRDLVIGIDCSTSATKAIAWDRDGEVAGAGRVEISLSNPKPGHFEQDPAAWWGSLTQALELLFAAVDPARVAGLAISNQRETFGFFDPDGTALAPATLWLDERARRQVERFGAEFGGARLHAISGKPLDIIPCLFRIIWFREHQPELVARAARIAEVHAFLVFHLTGRWATSIASADPTGLIDMRAMTWSDEILAAAGIPRAALPDLVRPGGLIGSVTAQAAAATGLLPGTPVIAGGGDGQCAGTGAGVLTPGRAYVNLGTAMVSGLYGRRYLHDVSFRTETAIAEEGYIYETCLRSGTFLVDWVMRELLAGRAAGADDFRALEAEAATSPVGAGGVVFLPYLQGVMDPHWDNAARAVLAGLSGSSRRRDIYRAALEGLALHQAETSRLASAAAGEEIDHFVAIGGGAASDLWLQILADATDRPVKRAATVEASSLGAAMAAAAGIGWYPTIAAASAAMSGALSRTFSPDPGRASRYRELRAIHADLWPALAAWNRRLFDFVERGDG